MQIIVLFVFIFFLINKFEAANKAHAEDVRPSNAVKPPEILVDDMVTFKGDASLVSLFGIKQSSLVDLKVVDGPLSFDTLGSGLQRLMRESYSQGLFRGPGFSGLVANEGTLRSSESLYLALFKLNALKGPIPSNLSVAFFIKEKTAAGGGGVCEDAVALISSNAGRGSVVQ